VFLKVVREVGGSGDGSHPLRSRGEAPVKGIGAHPAQPLAAEAFL